MESTEVLGAGTRVVQQMAAIGDARGQLALVPARHPFALGSAGLRLGGCLPKGIFSTL